jgi:dihydropyrimidine dehydrogenase (NAD+) subunit PreA
MVYGFKIVQDMVDGLSNFMDQKGYRTIEDFRGHAVPTVKDWQQLDLNITEKAVIDQSLCIGCGRCHVVCEDTSHQAITATKDGQRWFEVKEEDCVGCNLCPSVCPVPGCITLRRLAARRDRPPHRPAGEGRVRQLDHAPQQPGARMNPRRTAPRGFAPPRGAGATGALGAQ